MSVAPRPSDGSRASGRAYGEHRSHDIWSSTTP